MKPKKILRKSVGVALTAFGQMLLQEGAVWAARRVERSHGKRGRKKADPAVSSIVKEGAKFLEEQWSTWVAARLRDGKAPAKKAKRRGRKAGRKRAASAKARDAD
jgi:hypothetical protein